MLELLPLERGLFWGVLILSGIASVLAHVQITRSDVRFRRLLFAITSLQITLGAVLLILRAVTIKAFPITGVFESMLILMVFIGITFLFLSAFMQQVWFLSVMAWVLFAITVLAAVVAKPAAELQEAARTPWVIVHAISMSLSGAMIVFAAAMGILFLGARKRLKNKEFHKVFGRMPTIENLAKLNLLALDLCFAALTFGLVSGVGLVAVKSSGFGMTLADWLMDSKIVLVVLAWIILLVTLIIRYVFAFSGRGVAYATLVVCFMILFAFIGSRIFCKSYHDFESRSVRSNQSFQEVSCRLS
jgi:ABC-type uncharacterized transport system permease subunit